MIPRFFRRLWTGLGFVGRVYHADASGVHRISPATAWELGCAYHPSPAQAARNLAMANEMIEQARATRERMEVSQ